MRGDVTDARPVDHVRDARRVDDAADARRVDDVADARPVDGVTDARLAWNTWRRILTSDALVEAVLHPEAGDLATLGPRLGLGADELAVVDDYASSPAASDVIIGMYRRGLVRNALGALSLVPLTRRLLYTSGLEVSAVAAEFVKSMQYRDDGPNFWRAAADFVAYLGELPVFAPPCRQDVITLEAAAIALVRRLGEAPPAVWPEHAVAPATAGAFDRHVASRAAVVASSTCDLTPWLEDPKAFAVDAELERSPRHWLIYLPSADAMHCYAELSERAARAFAALAVPRTAAELASALDGVSAAGALQVLDSLLEIGAVARVPPR
jgi:hypothetical protein